MKVLLVSHNYPPLSSAGTELYTAQLAAGLRARGHEPLVFTTAKDISRAHLSLSEREHDGVRVLELVNNLHHESFRETWDQPVIERLFDGVLARERPELVHFQHLMHLSAGCAEAAARRGLPVVFTLHDFWLQCARHGQRVHADGSLCRAIELARCAGCMVSFPFAQSPLERRLSGWLASLRGATGLDLGPAARRARALLAGRAPAEDRALAEDPRAVAAVRAELEARAAGLRERLGRAVDRFLSPSAFLRARFVEWGLDPGRIEHLPTGVDLSLFGGRERAARGARLRVAFVGTLIRAKGPHVLLEAWGLLPAEARARAELELAGPARHEPAFQRELAAAAERVGARLRGPLDRAGVAAKLRATDLLVVPSVWFENAPLVILEALAARTPLLVSNLGGMAELVEEGLSGFHFELGDARDLAAKISAVIDDPASLDALYARPVALPAEAEHLDGVLAVYARVARERAAPGRAGGPRE